MVFHLDKCIGCHTCSLACKNLWTDRGGTDYMWWNNVETRPGTGYPVLWEDQEKFKGGWELKNGHLRLRSTGKASGLLNIFHNPNMPTMDDYYEPWTYEYSNLFNAPAGDDQPTARPISKVTGKYIDIKSGPNWDDDLSGSPIYAENDPNLAGLSDDDRKFMFQVERLVFFYLPRICNHCLNPACVAACPSGALYKRGEDGIVLVDQNVCRGWRHCVPACPYKKVFYNYKTGKSEKCILCYPKLESGQAQSCFHTCVGRIRYTGVLLYDAGKIESAMSVPDKDLVKSMRDAILDPNNIEVIQAAKKSGVHDSTIESARKSPVYKFVKDWNMALPLHPEARTFPMLFYVPPILPVVAGMNNGNVALDLKEFFSTTDKARIPTQFLANMFSAGNSGEVLGAYRPMYAARLLKRFQSVGDIPRADVDEALKHAGIDEKTCEQIYYLTALAKFDERMVIPPMHREEAVAATGDPLDAKGSTGLGFTRRPGRE